MATDTRYPPGTSDFSFNSDYDIDIDINVYEYTEEYTLLNHAQYHSSPTGLRINAWLTSLAKTSSSSTNESWADGFPSHIETIPSYFEAEDGTITMIENETHLAELEAQERHESSRVQRMHEGPYGKRNMCGRELVPEDSDRAWNIRFAFAEEGWDRDVKEEWEEAAGVQKNDGSGYYVEEDCWSEEGVFRF